ncbi:iron chelate uptake ABC transporter family permease subunit [Quadrisphaera sp. INWT6]|uniref:FecCD family ABC transporter permease n=1 Tax=Quadrisphaera sp. INWT6 TaxID=2596917 RepID=UPI0018923E4F|nr:iron chelate uptake ABC transporter family permease subunit [Quadrisphaera sp. INWT6]MBF5080927.1 iron chelate uptake ABC transporter family permease subunit [Quadrisphaera sp. INWT6]
MSAVSGLRRRSRSAVVGAVLAVVVVVLLLVSLGLGQFRLSPVQVLQALAGDGLGHVVVVQWRLPRALAAVVLGFGLAVAGALFQTVTRNPLASPDVVGLAHGAFTGVLVALAAGAGSWVVLTASAVAGGLAVAVAVWLLASGGVVGGLRLVVVGVGVAALLASVNTWLLLQVELDVAMSASAWGAGSLNGVTAVQTAPAAALTTVLVVGALALSRSLRQIDLGDDVAAATGVRVPAVRTAALLLGVLLVCVATAVVGPVAFVALVAPHVARRLARTPHQPLLLSGAAGALLLLVSDVVAQHALPVPLPAGVVTVSLGGAYLVHLVAREVRRR